MLMFYNETMREKVFFEMTNFLKHVKILALIEGREPKKNATFGLGDTLKHFKNNRTKTGEKTSLLCFSNYVNIE